MSPAWQLREAGLTAWWLRNSEPRTYPLANVNHFVGPCTRLSCRAARRNAARMDKAA